MKSYKILNVISDITGISFNAIDVNENKETILKYYSGFFYNQSTGEKINIIL